ncbi:MAG: hypothetical protein P4M14_10065 [Gammaproteobacteria bacterium]|nr:hypothetical protein [Gammaproteobacteria bacterium]
MQSYLAKDDGNSDFSMQDKVIELFRLLSRLSHSSLAESQFGASCLKTLEGYAKHSLGTNVLANPNIQKKMAMDKLSDIVNKPFFMTYVENNQFQLKKSDVDKILIEVGSGFTQLNSELDDDEKQHYTNLLSNLFQEEQEKQSTQDLSGLMLKTGKGKPSGNLSILKQLAAQSVTEISQLAFDIGQMHFPNTSESDITQEQIDEITRMSARVNPLRQKPEAHWADTCAFLRDANHLLHFQTIFLKHVSILDTLHLIAKIKLTIEPDDQKKLLLVEWQEALLSLYEAIKNLYEKIVKQDFPHPASRDLYDKISQCYLDKIHIYLKIHDYPAAVQYCQIFLDYQQRSPMLNQSNFERNIHYVRNLKKDALLNIVIKNSENKAYPQVIYSMTKYLEYINHLKETNGILSANPAYRLLSDMTYRLGTGSNTSSDTAIQYLTESIKLHEKIDGKLTEEDHFQRHLIHSMLANAYFNTVREASNEDEQVTLGLAVKSLEHSQKAMQHLRLVPVANELIKTVDLSIKSALKTIQILEQLIEAKRQNNPTQNK